MATKIRLFRATYRFAAELAHVMRPADVAEVEASDGYTPMEALEAAMAFSGPLCWGVTFNGEPGAMYGVGDADGVTSGTIGIPWLLTGEACDKYPTAFFRTCRTEVDAMLRLYSQLRQYIDARHTRALRWAMRLGFEIESPIPHGVGGMLFHPIVLNSKE